MARTFEIAFKLAGKIGSSFGRAFMSANERLQQMNRHISSLRSDLRKLEQDQKKGAIVTEEYALAYSKLVKEIEKAERAQKSYSKAVNLQRKVSDFRGRMRGNLLDAAGAAAAVGAPVYAAMQFESAMADVKKVIDFETPKQFKAMEKDIIKLSKRIPMTAEGLAQIVAAGGQAGIARRELVAFAEDAAKMGVAFDITAEEAGQMMAQWRSAFKMNQDQVRILADQINYLGNTTAASAPRISEVVRRIGPLGEVGGAAAAQIAALGATMVGAGVSEEVAATGIKNLILGLVAGESATKSQAEAFKALGLDAAQMAKLMQKDAQGAILKVLQALQKLPEHKRAAVLSDLFGKESIGAISPLLTNLDALKENFEKVGDASKYAGSMQKEFQSRSDTSANKIQLFKNRVTALGISVGNVLLPPLTMAIGKISTVTDKIQAFSDKHPGLMRFLVLGTASVLGFGVAFTALGYAASLVISPLVSFYAWAKKVELASKLNTAATKTWTAAKWLWNAAMSTGKGLLSVGRLVLYYGKTIAISVATRAWAAAQWLLNAAMSANPIGLVILALAGLVAGFVILYNRSEKVRNAVNALWNSLKSGAASAINFVINKINALIERINKIPGIELSKIPTVKVSSSKTSKPGRNATGTSNWRGGLTWINERGGEIIDLPRGTRIIPHDVSMEMARGGGINITYSPQIIVQGGGPDARRQAEQGARTAFDDFKAWWERMQRQEARLRFG